MEALLYTLLPFVLVGACVVMVVVLYRRRR